MKIRSFPLAYGWIEFHPGEPIGVLVKSKEERCAVDLTPEQARRVAQELIVAADQAERKETLA